MKHWAIHEEVVDAQTARAYNAMKNKNQQG